MAAGEVSPAPGSCRQPASVSQVAFQSNQTALAKNLRMERWGAVLDRTMSSPLAEPTAVDHMISTVEYTSIFLRLLL